MTKKTYNVLGFNVALPNASSIPEFETNVKGANVLATLNDRHVTTRIMPELRDKLCDAIEKSCGICRIVTKDAEGNIIKKEAPDAYMNRLKATEGIQLASLNIDAQAIADTMQFSKGSARKISVATAVKTGQAQTLADAYSRRLGRTVQPTEADLKAAQKELLSV